MLSINSTTKGAVKQMKTACACFDKFVLATGMHFDWDEGGQVDIELLQTWTYYCLTDNAGYPKCVAARDHACASVRLAARTLAQRCR